ncbi:hypothetical protein [Paraburkholderia nodosa]|uniref:hypothetical protein n=1 Tax=Paraburkholderia nodosa TaxID=392320 RepID=UPI00159F29CC|nr:hypothetical protein [Paraburkholderia nodosa]
MADTNQHDWQQQKTDCYRPEQAAGNRMLKLCLHRLPGSQAFPTMVRLLHSTVLHLRRRTQLLRLCRAVRRGWNFSRNFASFVSIARGSLPADSEGELDRRGLHTRPSERFNAAAV